MNRQRTAILVSMLCLAPLAARAAPDCAKPETQADMDICAGQDLKGADEELDRTYKLLARRLGDGAAKILLQEAEKTWEAYRDAECKFESSGAAGGTAENLVVAYCRAQRARTRIAVLKRMLDCKEGDLSCPPLKR